MPKGHGLSLRTTRLGAHASLQLKALQGGLTSSPMNLVSALMPTCPRTVALVGGGLWPVVVVKIL